MIRAASSPRVANPILPCHGRLPHLHPAIPQTNQTKNPHMPKNQSEGVLAFSITIISHNGEAHASIAPFTRQMALLFRRLASRSGRNQFTAVASIEMNTLQLIAATSRFRYRNRISIDLPPSLHAALPNCCSPPGGLISISWFAFTQGIDPHTGPGSFNGTANPGFEGIASTSSAVPEPSSFALLGLGGLGLAIGAYRRHRVAVV